MQAITVDVITPDAWFKRTRYRLRMPVMVGKYAAPAGYITDGATVPRFLSLLGAVFVVAAYQAGCIWLMGLGVLLMLAVAVFPAVGRYMEAAIIHDYMLEQYPNDRHKADRAFMEVMRELKIIAWRRWIMFICVWCWSEILMINQKLSGFTETE